VTPRLCLIVSGHGASLLSPRRRAKSKSVSPIPGQGATARSRRCSRRR
jgi:hypothetical protein